MANMRALLFGGSGMLGKAVLTELTARGHDVQFPAHCRCNISINIDVENYLSGVRDVVINCAGVIPPAPGKADIPDRDSQMILVNAIGPQVLAHECQKRNIRLIHISTDCVFSGLLFRSIQKTANRYEVADAPDGLDVYGRTKMLGETFVQTLGEKGAIVRTSFIGPDHGLLRWFLSQNGSKVQGYLNALWTGSTVWEVARGIADIVEDPDANGIIHLASIAAYSKHDILLRLAKILNLNIEIEPVKTPYLNRALFSTRTLKDLWDPAVISELVALI